MSHNNKAVLIKGNTAVGAGNYEGFLEFCTDDTKWTFVGEQTLEGKDAVRQWMAKSYISPPRVVVDQLIAEEDMLTAIGTVSMKNENGHWDRFSYCDVWRFRDGRMAELQAFVIKAG